LRSNPLVSITLTIMGLAAAAAACLAVLLWKLGMPNWASGVVGGWLAGTLNTALLAVRVSRLTAQSTVGGFLYGAASRFALVAVIFLLAYRFTGSHPVGFAIGLAAVVLSSLPVSLWMIARETA